MAVGWEEPVSDREREAALDAAVREVRELRAGLRSVAALASFFVDAEDDTEVRAALRGVAGIASSLTDERLVDGEDRLAGALVQAGIGVDRFRN